MPTWEIHMDKDDGSFWLQVGPRGIPGSIQVKGLSRGQGEALGCALIEIERVTKYRTLEQVRDALGIRQQ